MLDDLYYIQHVLYKTGLLETNRFMSTRLQEYWIIKYDGSIIYQQLISRYTGDL